MSTPAKGGVMDSGLYVPRDVDEAGAAWGANCGPAALAALLGREVAGVRELVQPFKGYMTPTAMQAALDRAGAAWVKAKVAPGWRGNSGGRALVFIQFEGPWTRPGVPARAAYQHTHWIASAGPLVYDVNFVPDRWDTWAAWERTVFRLLRAHDPRITGWSVRTVLVVRSGASTAAAAR